MAKAIIPEESEHKHIVEVTVSLDGAKKLLEDVSKMLDRSGLKRGEHWSLTAESTDDTINLKFGLCSQAFANLLRAAINIFVKPDHPAAKRAKTSVDLGVGGTVSGRFLQSARVRTGTPAKQQKPATPPKAAPVLDLPREFKHPSFSEDAFAWA